VLGRLPAKGLLALAAVVIAGTFVALMITSRGPTDEELAGRDDLDKYAELAQVRIDAEACHDAVDHAVTAAADYMIARYGEGAADAIRAIVQHRCEIDHWPSSVTKCLDRVTSDNEMQRCIGQLEDYQRRAVEAEMKAFVQRPPKSPDAGVDAAEVDIYGGIDPIDPSSSLPYSCQQYSTLMAKVMTCDKLPQASRDALKQGLDAMKSGWTSYATMPEEAREAMSKACQQAVDAMNQAMASICGW
jgi:hypothetical protein